jgi:CYTH domain-containing protein
VREPGRDPVRKLGQKVRFAAGNASAIAHTTMYLDEVEYALLSRLPGVTLSKTRHVVPLSDGLEVAVDVFHGRLTGLTMAEFDLGVSGSLPEPVPTWLGVEVTEVEEFTGHALACMEAEELARLLAAYNV